MKKLLVMLVASMFAAAAFCAEDVKKAESKTEAPKANAGAAAGSRPPMEMHKVGEKPHKGGKKVMQEKHKKGDSGGTTTPPPK